MTAARRFLGRWLATLAMMAVVLWQVEVEVILIQMASVDLRWLLLALAVTPLQVVLSAWRWRYTVARLGLALPLGHAVREYYLATLINQLLPGGMVGDAGRALRHRQHTGQTANAVHGVMIERLSGQVVLLFLAALLIGLWLPLPVPPMPGLYLILGAVAVVLLGWILLRIAAVRGWWRRFQGDLKRALLSPQVLPIQLLSSVLVIASYLLVFWCLAMGLGLTAASTTPGLFLALCTVLLMAMVIPLTVAGWGVREGAAAALWPLAGLDPEQGVALAVSYGLLVLVSALPGVLFINNGRPSDRRNPDQTAYRSPD